MSNVATLSPKPTMPMAAKHRKALSPFTDDDGRISTADVHAGMRLIPEADLPVIVAELERALAPCPDTHALAFAKQLVGCYRIKDVVDASIYVSTMASKFQKFPPDICAKIVEAVTDRLKFPPAPADIIEDGRKFMREREATLRAAKRHEAEWERRKTEAQATAERKGQCETREADLKALYDELGWDWPGYDKASWPRAILAKGATDAEPGLSAPQAEPKI